MSANERTGFAFLPLVAPSRGRGGGGERPAFSGGGTLEAKPSRRIVGIFGSCVAYRDHGRRRPRLEAIAGDRFERLGNPRSP